MMLLRRRDIWDTSDNAKVKRLLIMSIPLPHPPHPPDAPTHWKKTHGGPQKDYMLVLPPPRGQYDTHDNNQNKRDFSIPPPPPPPPPPPYRQACPFCRVRGVRGRVATLSTASSQE